MAVRLRHGAWSEVDQSQPSGTAVVDVGPMGAHSSVVFKTLDNNEVFAGRCGSIGCRLGSNIKSQRLSACAGEFEIEVRRQCESGTFIDIVRLGIDRNLACSTGRIKNLLFP